MNEWKALLRVAFNNNFGLSALRYRFRVEKKKRWEPIVIAVSIVVGLGPLLVPYVATLNGLYDLGSRLGQPQVPILWAVLLGQLLVLFFGVFMLMGSFYHSRDLTILVPLPLTPTQVLTSKLLQTVVNEYLILAPLFWPAMFVYGLRSQAGLLFWMAGAVVFLLLPVLPLTIAALVVLPLMRAGVFRRNRDAWSIVVGVIALVLAFGVQFAMRAAATRVPPEELTRRILNANMGLLKAIGGSFPPGLWATRAITEAGRLSGLGQLFLYLVLTAALLWALMALARRMFYRALLAGTEAHASKGALDARELARETGLSRSARSALVGREWKLLWRTPVWVLNGPLPALFVPILLASAVLFPQAGTNMPNPVTLIHATPLGQTLAGLALIGASMLFSSLFAMPSSALSREGRQVWISKTIPVEAGVQVDAKMRQAMLVSILSMTPTWIVSFFALRLSVWHMAVAVFIGLIGTRTELAVSLAIDLYRPYLDWDNPQFAVKRNMNVMLGLIASIWVAAPIAAIGLLGLRFHIGGAGIYGLAAVYAVLSAWGASRWVKRLADRRYRKIEV